MQGRLEILTLGGLFIKLNGIVLQGFASRKVEALVVYLARNQRPYSREFLAELLWEERSQSRSLSNLRVVLSSLREHNLEPFIDITRQNLAMIVDDNVWVDVLELDNHLKVAEKEWRTLGRMNRTVAQRLDKAVKLYVGDFLDGFYLKDSGGFDDWVMIEREELRRKMIETLSHLTNYHLELEAETYTGGRDPRYLGIEYANRSLHLDPLREETYRQLMMLHARLGQKNEAISRYEDCRRTLQKELGVKPSEETNQLLSRIQAGHFKGRGDIAATYTRAHPPAQTDRINWREDNPEPPDKQVTSTTTETEIAPNLRVCRYCQHEIPTDALVCDNCGKGAKTTVSLGYLEPEAGDTYFGEDTILLMHFFGIKEPLRIRVPLDKGITLGRVTSDIDLSPLDALENGVSRNHVIVQRRGETLIISDLDSSNGSYLNGQRLYPHEVRVLRHGDELRLGKLVSRIRFYHP